MKQFFKAFRLYKLLRIWMLVFAIGMAGFVMLYSVPAVNAQAAEGIKLNKTKLTIEVESSYTLKVSGTKDKVTWTSSNKDIAKVSNTGKVTGVKEGKASITATVAGKKYSCDVTVKKSEYKIAGSGLAEVKTHQEVMNELNMTVIKTIDKVLAEEMGDGALRFEEKTGIVEIKLGYFTDKNMIKHYMVVVTNLTDKAFDDNDGLSYESENGFDEYETFLPLSALQPGESRFYRFGSSYYEYGYTDYNYFKGLKFAYSSYYDAGRSRKDIRKDFKIYSLDKKPYMYMKLEGKQGIKDNYNWEILLFLLDKNGELFDIQYMNTYYIEKEISTYKGIPSKIFVVVEYIAEVEYLEQTEWYYDEYY